MIGSITVDIDGKRKQLRFSTRAQARVERALGCSVQKVFSGFSDGQFGTNAACEILASAWNDGRGADVGIAYDTVDLIGAERTFEIVGDLVKAAFPEADEAPDGAEDTGNAKKPKS